MGRLRSSQAGGGGGRQLLDLGLQHHHNGRYSEAAQTLEASLAALSADASDAELAYGHGLRGLSLQAGGALEAAEGEFREQLRCGRRGQDLRALRDAHGNLADNQLLRGRHPAARYHFERQLRLCRRLRDLAGVSQVLGRLAAIDHVTTATGGRGATRHRSSRRSRVSASSSLSLSAAIGTGGMLPSSSIPTATSSAGGDEGALSDVTVVTDELDFGGDDDDDEAEARAAGEGGQAVEAAPGHPPTSPQASLGRNTALVDADDSRGAGPAPRQAFRVPGISVLEREAQRQQAQQPPPRRAASQAPPRSNRRRARASRNAAESRQESHSYSKSSARGAPRLRTSSSSLPSSFGSRVSTVGRTSMASGAPARAAAQSRAAPTSSLVPSPRRSGPSPRRDSRRLTGATAPVLPPEAAKASGLPLDQGVAFRAAAQDKIKERAETTERTDALKKKKKGLRKADTAAPAKPASSGRRSKMSNSAPPASTSPTTAPAPAPASATAPASSIRQAAVEPELNVLKGLREATTSRNRKKAAAPSGAQPAAPPESSSPWARLASLLPAGFRPQTAGAGPASGRSFGFAGLFGSAAGGAAPAAAEEAVEAGAVVGGSAALQSADAALFDLAAESEEAESDDEETMEGDGDQANDLLAQAVVNVSPPPAPADNLFSFEAPESPGEVVPQGLGHAWGRVAAAPSLPEDDALDLFAAPPESPASPVLAAPSLSAAVDLLGLEAPGLLDQFGDLTEDLAVPQAEGFRSAAAPPAPPAPPAPAATPAPASPPASASGASSASSSSSKAAESLRSLLEAIELEDLEPHLAAVGVDSASILLALSDEDLADLVLDLVEEGGKRIKWKARALPKKVAVFRSANGDGNPGVLAPLPTIDSDSGLTHISSVELLLGRNVGAGAYGSVFQAKWGAADVAVKQILQSAREEDLKDDMLREAKLLASVKHENVVEFLGVCLDGKHPSLVMEWAAGGSLGALIRQYELDSAVVCDFATQLARGMDYLHSCPPHGIVHRDLKSHNILLQHPADVSPNVLKISDFGAAKDSTRTEQLSGVAGTVAWTAPECWQLEQYSKFSDSWSFGVVVWELLTGETPFKGYENGAVIYGVVTGKLRLPVPNPCPETIRLLLEGCWRSEPHSRPDFKAILKSLSAGEEQLTSLSKDELSGLREAWRADFKGHVDQQMKDVIEQIQAPVNAEAVYRRQLDELEQRRRALDEEREILEREKKQLAQQRTLVSFSSA